MTAGLSSELLSLLLMPVSKFRPWLCQGEKKQKEPSETVKKDYMNVSFVVSVHVECASLFSAKNMQQPFLFIVWASIRPHAGFR